MILEVFLFQNPDFDILFFFFDLLFLIQTLKHEDCK